MLSKLLQIPSLLNPSEYKPSDANRRRRGSDDANGIGTSPLGSPSSDANRLLSAGDGRVGRRNDATAFEGDLDWRRTVLRAARRGAALEDDKQSVGERAKELTFSR
jgi:hypothetical protein